MATISQRIALEGAEEIRRQLLAVGKTGAASFQEIEAAGIKAAQGLDRIVNAVARVERSFVALNASARAFGSSLSSAGQAFGSFEGAILRSVRNIGLLTAAVGGAAVGFTALVKGAADAADNIGEQAAGLGLTTDRYQELAAAATDSGIEQEQFGRGMGNLAKIIKEDAEKALKDAGQEVLRLGLRFPRTAAGAAAFAAAVGRTASNLQRFVTATGQGETTLGRLGIRTLDAAGNLRNVGDVFLDVADAVAKLPPGIEKTTLVMELFGARMGRRFVDLLDKGAEGIKELGKQFAALKFTPEEIKIGDEFAKQFGILDLVVTRARQKLALLFGPSFTNLMAAFADRLIGSFEGIHAGLRNVIDQEIAPVIADLITLISGEQTPIRTDWVRNLEANFRRAGQVISQAVGIIGVAFQALRTGAASIAGVINNIFGTNISGDALLLAAAILKVTGILSLFVSGLTLAGAAGLLFIRTIALVGSALRLLAVGLAAVGVINPFGAVVAALAVLVVLFATSSDEIQKIWKDLWAKLGPIAIEGVRAIGLQIKQALVDALSGPWLTLEVGGKEIFKFAPIVKSAGEAGKVAGDTFAQRFEGATKETTEGIAERLKRLFVEGMKNVGFAVDPKKLDEITGKTSNLTETLKRLGITTDSMAPKFKAVGQAGKLAFDSIRAAAEDAGTKIRDINAKAAASAADLLDTSRDLAQERQEIIEAGGDTEKIDRKIATNARKMRELEADRVRQVQAVAVAEQANIDAIKRYNAELALQLRMREQGFPAAGPQIIKAPEPRKAAGADTVEQRKAATVDPVIKDVVESAKQLDPALDKLKSAVESAAVPIEKGLGLEELQKQLDAAEAAAAPPPVPPTEDPGLQNLLDAADAAARGLDQLTQDELQRSQELNAPPPPPPPPPPPEPPTQPFWEEPLTRFGGALEGLVTTVDASSQQLDAAFDQQAQAIGGAGIQDALSQVASEIQSVSIGDSLQQVDSSSDQLDGSFNELTSAASGAAQALAQVESNGGGFASGGMIQGPGTSTSDSILARLSRGEFVVRAAAVRHYGPALLSALNSLRIPRPTGFNLGGLVDGMQRSLMIPRFAEGGLADMPLVGAGSASGRSVNLTINNGVSKESFRMWADEEVAKKVVRYAVSRQVASAGRKSGAFG